MFAASVYGKDGNVWSIYLPVDTWEDARNMVDVLGLDVTEDGLGELVAYGSIDQLSDVLLTGGLMNMDEAERLLEEAEVAECMFEKTKGGFTEH